MRIWANHAHVFPQELREEGSLDNLLLYMDSCEIEGCVAFAPLARQVRELGLDPNVWLAEAVKRRPDRIIAFGTIDLGGSSFKSQVKKIHDLGMRGIKIHPPGQRTAILADALLEVYAEAEKRELFISFHTGPHRSRLASLRVLDFDEIALRFPRLRFSLEHVGGYAGLREAVGVIQNNEHRPHTRGVGTVFAGLTTVFHPRWREYYLSPMMLEELVYRIGEDHIIFGLDFPYNDVNETKEAIKIINHLNISTAAKEKILGEVLHAQIAL